MEYEWNLRQEEMDESDDDLDDKVSANGASTFLLLLPGCLHCVDEIILRKTVWSCDLGPVFLLGL